MFVALPSLALVPLFAARSLVVSQLAMTSPWWENYEVRETYRCSDRSAIVVERNDSQASLIAGGYRSTLFRERADSAGLMFRNGAMALTLNGDELTLERDPMRLTCIRTDQV